MNAKMTKAHMIPFLAIACALLATLVVTPTAYKEVSAAAGPVLADLPPRPTPDSLPGPAHKKALAGGWIELQVQFPATTSYPRQGLWTVVQWQDEWGHWRDVQGWQGTLDEVEADGGSDVVGWKKWWVDKEDLGKGPFRWQVYQSKGGRALATSAPFDLPGSSGATVVVEVSLAP